MATVLSGEENSDALLIYWAAIRETRSNPPQITQQAAQSGGEKKNQPKQMYKELSETARYQKAASMRCNNFTLSPLGGYPPNSDFIISAKKNIIPPIAEVSMKMASYKALHKNNKSASPIFF